MTKYMVVGTGVLDGPQGKILFKQPSARQPINNINKTLSLKQRKRTVEDAGPYTSVYFLLTQTTGHYERIGKKRCHSERIGKKRCHSERSEESQLVVSYVYVPLTLRSPE